MLRVYTWHTPNGRKLPILLAELGLDYELELVDLGKNEQKRPAYLAINPNGKIPALVDGETKIFESGACLEYLADKTGRFLARSGSERYETLSWLYWQVGGPGPMFGKLGGFEREMPRDEHAVEKFFDESKRLALVLDGRLRDREWIAREYSIADIACYPWFEAVQKTDARVLADAHAVRRWMDRMAARPAVAKGMKLER